MINSNFSDTEAIVAYVRLLQTPCEMVMICDDLSDLPNKDLRLTSTRRLVDASLSYRCAQAFAPPLTVTPLLCPSY